MSYTAAQIFSTWAELQSCLNSTQWKASDVIYCIHLNYENMKLRNIAGERTSFPTVREVWNMRI